MNVITGKVWKFGDNIDTDLIIAARYLNTSDPHELARHVMEDADPDFVHRMQPGDIIVAGENFGCGSSREHAPIALKAAGVAAVVAKSFARIFYRNAFNMGLPIFELAETDKIEAGDLISIEMDKGNIVDLNREVTYSFRPIPEFMQELLACGGLMNYAKAEMLKQQERA
ncbi:3-isopropylmalate dehydratase small subunit [Hydrogenimonas sp.]|nr:3-isopropylmalate dehydratase small subunit [Hydrogenimonas sp.]